MNIDEKIKKMGLARSYLNKNDEIEEIQINKLHALVDLLDPTDNNEPQTLFEDCYVIIEGDILLVTPNIEHPDLSQVVLTLENEKKIPLTFTSGGIHLPSELPFGYHQINVQWHNQAYACRVIYAPKKCYTPDDFYTNKIWGFAVQLYTVRSESNWGLGNLTDLQMFAEKGAALGANVLGLNPLHLLYNDDGRICSPYSPSSRLLLDPKYIDWQKLPEAEKAMTTFYAENETLIHELRAVDLVDYQQYSQLIFLAAKVAYKEFVTHADQKRIAQFNAYVKNSSESHHLICLFQALYHYFYQKNNAINSWQQWPAEYQNYQSQAVQKFLIEYHEEVRFYQFMQWVADEQLAATQAAATGGGMSLGLYRDLAVGVDNHGAETWMYGDVYNCDVSVGAPPDELALHGQNWQLPVMNPRALKARGYEPFTQMIRANMAHAGALRIDHIMGLFRIWCMPAGQDASNGTYIHYPLRELMGILALESQRQQCMVIGEDLGMVPQEISKAMNDADIYSYKVFLFERENNEQDLKSPQNYEKRALATLSTHDLPTMAGYWQSVDLDILKRLKLFPSESDYQRLSKNRASFQQAFVRAINNKTTRLNEKETSISDLNSKSVVALAHEYLASSQANITVFQPDDFLAILNPINLPGTTDQYPNWRRKLSHTVEDFFDCDERVSQMKRINNKRKNVIR
ncbi:4-alpha-glucanotransferase [Pseudomonas sp. HK3]